MSCPTDGRYTTDLFEEAVVNLDLWEMGFCAFGAPLGEMIVGTVVYSAFGLNIFIRTGSLIIPFVLAMILGGTILAQMLAIINTITGLVVLIAAPLVLTAAVMMVERRG